MAKTETITIRVTPQDKQFISNLAWIMRRSVSDTLTYIARKEMNELKKSGYPMPDESFLRATYENQQWLRETKKGL